MCGVGVLGPWLGGVCVCVVLGLWLGGGCVGCWGVCGVGIKPWLGGCVCCWGVCGVGEGALARRRVCVVLE